MAKKLALKMSEPRHKGDQDLPAARLPDSAFPSNSYEQVVSVQEDQRAANSYKQLLARGRDTSEVQELRKAGYGQEQPSLKKAKPEPKKEKGD